MFHARSVPHEIPFQDDNETSWIPHAIPLTQETVLHQLLLHTDLHREDIAVWGDKVATHNLPSAQRIHIIGIESMSSSDRTVLAYRAMVTPSSFVAVDESGYIKGHSSNRTTRITDLSEPARYRLIMTGTPFTQGVVDLFAQMRFLSPRILGYRSFYSFARNHLEFRKVVGQDGIERNTNHVIRAHDTAALAAKIAPYTYQVRKDECLSLPDKMHEVRWCSMTGGQRELYDRVKERILYELEYEDWSPIRIFHLFTALQTVVCGWYADPVRGLYEVEHNRLSLLLATVAEIPAGERVIIWAKYRRAVDEISQALAPAARFVVNTESQATRLDAIAFNAAENQLAEHLTKRHGGQLQAIMDQIKRLDSGGKRLQTLAHYTRDWTHPDAEIHRVLQLIGVVLELIHLRLPALAEKLHNRLIPGQPALSPWTSPKRKA